MPRKSTNTHDSAVITAVSLNNEKIILERSKNCSDSDKFRRQYGVGKKLLKNRADNKQLKNQEKTSNTSSCKRGTVPITPQMIRTAVKELHTKRVFVSSSLIANHLQRCYPIENDPTALKKELEDKLNVAVSVGLIAKCGADAYYLPTFRQQATNRKTDFSSFWERYNKRGPTRRNNCLENTRKKLKKPLQRGLANYSENIDDDENI